MVAVNMVMVESCYHIELLHSVDKILLNMDTVNLVKSCYHVELIHSVNKILFNMVEYGKTWL